MRGAAEIRRDCELLALSAEVEALKCERQAMIARNQEREFHGAHIAYGDAAFEQLAEGFRVLAAKLREA
jgi:hypothetical protein